MVLGMLIWTGELEFEGFNLNWSQGSLEFVNGMLIFPTSQLFCLTNDRRQRLISHFSPTLLRIASNAATTVYTSNHIVSLSRLEGHSYQQTRYMMQYRTQSEL
jgi:hypothetical protein